MTGEGVSTQRREFTRLTLVQNEAGTLRRLVSSKSLSIATHVIVNISKTIYGSFVYNEHFKNCVSIESELPYSSKGYNVGAVSDKSSFHFTEKNTR